ncbi:MAG: hypothetical protein IAG10_26380 [Planctomycetaceae bacterium]|nr:hypothetical protein [Planctomycetaceae bacterium]
MREFFKGWRRKAGLVALAMACGFMMLCFRSYLITDFITTRTSDNSYQFVTTDGGDVVWGRSRSDSLIGQPARWSWSSRAYRRRPFTLPKGWQISAQRTILGAEFMTLRREDITMSSWRVPYWSLVLPLTLLSALLLLIKTRSAKEPNRG